MKFESIYENAEANLKSEKRILTIRCIHQYLGCTNALAIQSDRHTVQVQHKHHHSHMLDHKQLWKAQVFMQLRVSTVLLCTCLCMCNTLQWDKKENSYMCVYAELVKCFNLSKESIACTCSSLLTLLAIVSTPLWSTCTLVVRITHSTILTSRTTSCCTESNSEDYNQSKQQNIINVYISKFPSRPHTLYLLILQCLPPHELVHWHIPGEIQTPCSHGGSHSAVYKSRI